MAKNKQQPGRVKSALLNWLGVPIGLTTGEFWQGGSGPAVAEKLSPLTKLSGFLPSGRA